MRRLSGFSLMEMMTVLLIVSVVAAASAPMINKRMMVNQAAGGCVWEQLGGSIYYNREAGNSSVIIGADTTNNNNNNNNLSPKLHIRTIDADPFITFERDGVNNHLALNYRADTLGLSANPPADGATVIGANANATDAVGATVIGANALARINSIAIGRNAQTAHRNAIVIGDQETDNASMTGGDNAIAIGHFARALSSNSIAIGSQAIITSVDEGDSILIGNNTRTTGVNIIHSKESIAIGNNSRTGYDNNVAIGNKAHGIGYYSIAIGGLSQKTNNSDAKITRTHSNKIGAVAIGNGSQTDSSYAVALGYECYVSDNKGVAIGYLSEAGERGVAIGNEAKAPYPSSVAIGSKAEATQNDQIVLGSSDDTVYIPGNLVVGGDVLLNAEKGSTFLRVFDSGDGQKFNNQKTYLSVLHSGDFIGADDNFWKFYANNTNDCIPTSQKTFVEAYTKSDNVTTTSDRRLKNVGKAFTSGLAEIKKLEVFNYTFKKDESKTPRVGVMAQDLQKIFPNAVTKGEDGFLRIRMEDMFYAVVNAVKELASMFDRQDERIVQLEKENKELHKTINDLEKRLEKLEKQK